MIQFAIACTPIEESEQRVFGEPVARMAFAEYDVASGNTLILANRFRPVVDALTSALGADGIAIDVYPTETREDGSQHDYAIIESIECVPSRPTVFWHGDECHDNGHPHCETLDMDL